MTHGSEVFAAKCFKALSNSEGPISSSQNHTYIEQEVCRNVIAADIGQSFLEHAHKAKVDVYCVYIDQSPIKFTLFLLK